MLFNCFLDIGSTPGNFWNPASDVVSSGTDTPNLANGTIFVVPNKGILKNLYLYTDGEQSDIEMQVDIYKNGIPSGLNATIFADHSSGSNNHTVIHVVQGDLITVRLDPGLHSPDGVTAVSFFFQAT